MSFQPACRPATGTETSLLNQTIVVMEKTQAPQSLNMAHPKVDFSPPGTLVKMKCVRACASNQKKPAQGSPLASVRPGEQCKYIWTEEENLRPTGNRVVQSNLPVLARMQFSRRQSFDLCFYPRQGRGLHRVINEDSHMTDTPLSLLREPQIQN